MKQRPYKLRFGSDEETIAAIKKLPKSHQSIIGRIIWWDFYAGRLVANRSTLFDDWLNEPPTDKEPSSSALEVSLQKMGYDKDTAKKRFEAKYKPSRRKHND